MTDIIKDLSTVFTYNKKTSLATLTGTGYTVTINVPQSQLQKVFFGGKGAAKVTVTKTA